MNETECAAAVAAGLRPSPTRFGHSVYLAMRISGTGGAVRPSIGEKCWRDPAIWLSPETQARVAGLPIVLDHPETASLNPDEYAGRSIGAICLPYVADRGGMQNTDGPDLWGVARLFIDDDALKAISDRSTSPCVVFTATDGNQTITLDDGTECLVEASPTLIDHCAIVMSGDGAGVWDLGQENSGIRFDIAGVNAMDETETAAEKARKDAEKNGEVLDKILSHLDDGAKKMDAIGKRLDALEKSGKESAEEKASREDAARRDLETREHGKPWSAADSDRDRKDYSENMEAQARADSAFVAWGLRAPPPMQSEKPINYRRRLLRPLQQHSATFKGADLAIVAADSAAFNAIEETIFADAKKASVNPPTTDGVSIKRVAHDPETGHRVTTFHGGDTVFKRFTAPSMRATKFNVPEARDRA